VEFNPDSLFQLKKQVAKTIFDTPQVPFTDYTVIKNLEVTSVPVVGTRRMQSAVGDEEEEFDEEGEAEENGENAPPHCSSQGHHQHFVCLAGLVPSGDWRLIAGKLINKFGI
jgi:hypothetical protein